MTAPILYVEDEEDYQRLVTRILKRAGLEVVLAESGESGVKALEQARPSLLILDVNLPDTDGYRICTQLRQDPIWMDLPILLLTVRRRPDEWLLGFSCGATDYLSKPLNPSELTERVLTCLEGRARLIAGSGRAEYNLIQAAVAGNRPAFEVLIQKYKERLMTSLRNSVRNDALLDDVVAHAFSIAFETLREFRGESSFYTWVYRIALNDSIRVYRRPSAAVSLEDLSDGEDRLLFSRMAAGEPLENTLADRQIQRRALEALGQVPEPYRKILDLYILQDLSYEKIAKHLRIPQGTVMSRLHKARKLLQGAWSQKEVTPA